MKDGTPIAHVIAAEIFSRRRMIAALLLAMAMVCAGCGDDDEGAASPAGPTFGDTVAVNTHYAGLRGALDVPAIAKLGAAGVRLLRNDLEWAAVEHTPGVYDFSTTRFDALADAAVQNGMRMLFILDYGNTLYGPARAVVDDAGRAAFARFAAAAASRYSGRHFVWEIWNEPNLPEFWSTKGAGPDPAQYALLVDAAVPAIRAADPTATILIGAVFDGLPDFVPILGGIPGADFLARLFATGVLDRVDGVSAHFYRSEPPETVATDVGVIRDLMAAAGRTVPVWSGEWGYSTYDPTARPTGINYLLPVTLDGQASYVARMFLSDYELGLAGSVYYQDREPANPSPGNIEDNWGLMLDDLSPKPSYQALSTLTRFLGDGRLADRLSLGSGAHGLVFDAGGEVVTALWAENPVTWRLRAADSSARVIGRDGADITPADLHDGAALAVQPDQGPIYLQGKITVGVASE